nr:O-antigen ligase family protein [Acinetobacter indicus]
MYLTFFIFLTGSRAGWLTLFLLIFLAIIFRQKKEIKFNFFFFGMLNILYLIFSYSFSNNSRNTIKSLERTFHDSRLSLWSDSVSSIWANPWLGYGVNGVRSSRLFGDQNFKIPYTSSHNIFLDLFLWFGFLGGIFFCFFLIYIFLKFIVNKEYEIFIFLIPFLIHSLLEYPFRYLYFLVLIIPVFSMIKGVKTIYISRFVFLGLFLVYIFLVVILSIEFNRYSRGAFFSQSQKCEVVVEDRDPILMDLMYKYSNLYCNKLNEYEIRKVIYRYSYPVHIQYYIEQGFYDKKLYKMYEKNK